MTEETFAADTIDVEIDVSFASGFGIQDLTGATIVAVASRPGYAVVNGAGVVADPNTVQVAFPAAALGQGIWLLQVRATKAGKVKTLFSEIYSVQESI